MKLSEQDKLAKQRRDSLLRTSNRLKSEFSFKKIRTYRDYYLSLGRDQAYVEQQPNKDQPLTFDALKIELDKLRDELEKEIQELNRKPELSSPVLAGEPAQISKTGKEIKVPVEKEISNSQDSEYGLTPSPKQKAFLFWFQKKAAAQLLDGILVKKKPGQYLIAKAGDGKTYIIGAVLRRLLDMGWHKQDCISPWPIIYVTKASVVIQTKRVLEKDFSIDILNEVTVIGIDQLRARFGQMFVNEKMQIIGGEEVYSYEWRPMINPKLIIWDEGHALKNYGSTQHKIGISYSTLPNVYQIFSSATPAMRVSEFKPFVLSVRLQFDL